ncbi:hypothetical protein BU25DRAFT_62856 [Macroventuria anomochaeta]|uniref:Uncharacterized protein n=1 Tax=Macroventuria anomochaeta TaxID=301207 RepID=A0ACB6S033_9PLEO|nr:uncharacterized protein BU25DRAFT_62856 [Macroventuria anomochaeta]KAF2627394.1 hypothetical protein BU25DRAFT_62856 [Macroventuria anomochaeta]
MPNCLPSHISHSRRHTKLGNGSPIPMLDLAQPTIPFERPPLPEMGLIFLPRPSLPDSRKRGRAAANIDGEHSCTQKKKRRLRLFLITSRLSPQFSHPATNIVDRGSSKIAVWAKQKALGRNILRKAAILNRIRRRAVSAREAVSRGRLLVEQEKEQHQLEMARLTFHYGSIDTYTRPVHSQTQSVPSSAAVRNGCHYLVSGSLTGPPSGSPTTSRSPSPILISPPLNGPGHDASSEYRSPNAAYALSPPRAQSSTRTYEPHLPSPLGLSNYDAFDVEDLGAKDNTHTDLYSHLDDDDEEDRYSYLWDEFEDERHGSPFSPSVATNDSRTTAKTGASQVLKTPPQVAYDDFDIAESLLSGFEEGDESVNSVWPSPFLGAEAKATTKGSRGAASPNFHAFDKGPLAVQYPGAPVPYSEQTPVTTSPAVSPNLVPASMSPNFLPADSTGWPESVRWEERE